MVGDALIGGGARHSRAQGTNGNSMGLQALKEIFHGVHDYLGGATGNTRLRRALKLAETSYEAVKLELIVECLVLPGRDREGSVPIVYEKAPELKSEPLPAVSLIVTRPKPPRTNGADLSYRSEILKAAENLRDIMELGVRAVGMPDGLCQVS